MGCGSSKYTPAKPHSSQKASTSGGELQHPRNAEIREIPKNKNEGGLEINPESTEEQANSAEMKEQGKK